MHTSLILFIAAASLSGTVFLLALVELYFTKRRHRMEASLHEQLKDIRGRYNEAMNKMVLEEEAKLDSSDRDAGKVLEAQRAEVAKLQEEYKTQLEQASHSQDRALASAKARARELERQAKQQADQYLATRQREVEADLMDLVIHVTKRVLPQSLTYDIQKKLVLDALHEVELSKAPEQ